MLPGLRFLFAAVVLSMSVLVFGLGAASLLRASHDRFVSTSRIRSAPPPMYAQHSEPAMPVLTMLRVDVPNPAPEASSDAAVADASPAVAPEARQTPPAEVAMTGASDTTEAPKPATVSPIPEADVPPSTAAKPAADAPITVASAPVAAEADLSPSPAALAVAEPSPPAADQPAAPAVAVTPDATELPVELAALSEALPAVPPLPEPRPVIKKKRHASVVHRLIKKHRHIVRQRAPAAEQAFGTTYTGG